MDLLKRKQEQKNQTRQEVKKRIDADHRWMNRSEGKNNEGIKTPVMLTLDVAVATFRPDGILRVEKMMESITPQNGVNFIVSWQEHEDREIPEALKKREDVKIYRLEIKGVSNNRNNALEKCEGDLVLIADDDLEYNPNSFQNIREFFTQRPQMDIGLFKMEYPIAKSYPEVETDINLPFPKNYYGSAVEIAFRRDKIGDLKFWPGIGPGNEFLKTGEDEFFLVSAIKRGIKTKFIPFPLGCHPTLTTGNKVNEGVLRGQGFIIGVVYPFTSVIRIPLKAYRLYKRHNVSFFNSMKELIKGALYSKRRWNKIPIECRW